MALGCLAGLVRVRGRVVARGWGFASPLTYSLTVAVTYSRLRWVKEGFVDSLLLRPRVKPRGPCACPSPSPALEGIS